MSGSSLARDRSSLADRFVEIDGRRLHVVDWGGDGPPIVLHHATGFLARVYDPIARGLEARFHVFGLDGRGHGRSDKPASGYSWEGFIADLIGVVEALGIGPVAGIGHSLGGTTVAGAAAARPDLFDRVVLLDPILLPREFRNVTPHRNPMADAARRRRTTWSSAGAVLESYASRAPFATWTDEALRLYVKHGFEPIEEGRVRLRCPPEIEAQVFSMATDFDGWSLLDRVEAPALVLRGETSQAFSARDSKKAIARLRRGEAGTLTGAGHLFPMEQPEETIRRLVRFLEARE